MHDQAAAPLVMCPFESTVKCGQQTGEDEEMIKSHPLATFGAAVAISFVANVSAAAPLSHGADAIVGAIATLSPVEQAHGIHRACRLGRVSRWGGIVRWHRHVGRADVPVRC